MHPITTIPLLAALLAALALIAPVAGRAADAAAPAAEPAAAAAAEPTEADLQVLLNTVRANRRALVSLNLNLTADEAAKFWPLFERYQAEMNAIGDRVLALVEDYAANFATLANDKALQLMTDYLAAEAERVKVRQTWLPQFAAVLPGRTVARFYQLENKLDALVRYDLAATIPVIDEKAAAPAP